MSVTQAVPQVNSCRKHSGHNSKRCPRHDADELTEFATSVENAPGHDDVFREDSPTREALKSEINTRALCCNSGTMGSDQVHFSREIVQLRSGIRIKDRGVDLLR